jgi:hypothetical protein
MHDGGLSRAVILASSGICRFLKPLKFSIRAEVIMFLPPLTAVPLLLKIKVIRVHHMGEVAYCQSFSLFARKVHVISYVELRWYILVHAHMGGRVPRCYR